MRLHQQFDLKIEPILGGRQDLAIHPYVIEELIANLTRKGYRVIKSSANHMGMPQSITIIKDFTGPFAAMFSAKAKEDFDSITKRLGIDGMFQ